MKISAIASALLLAGANAATLKKVGGEVIPGEYIVVMKEGANESALDKAAANCFSKGVWKSIPGFRGFAARLNQAELDAILANPDVEFVEPDSVVHAIGSVRGVEQATCKDEQTVTSSWGQSRTTRVSSYNTRSFEHDNDWGKGVKVFVIDTGTNCGHNDFAGSCSCGPSYISGSADGCSDGHGHGTHCSSTATGAIWGIAKSAEAVGVKVLGDNGSGATSGVISGMNWVATQGAGNVASMSLGGGYSSASNNAVDGMSRAGIFVAVAAGNDGRDACNYSPASAPTAYTVGSTDSSDRKSSFSNIGKCVDIFAPGSSITAARGSSGSSSTTMSGTSMACPHVAGAAAAILSENPSYSVDQVKSALTNLALDDVIQGSVGTNSPNKLLHLEC